MNLKLYTKSLRFLGPRPRTEKEIKDYLKKYKATDIETAEILGELIRNNYINDEEFAKAWIRTRALLKPKGWIVIKMELREKGISDGIISRIEEEQKSKMDTSEKDLVISLIERRIGRYTGLPRQEIYQKLGGFLMRRGFSFDMVKKCIDEVLKKHV